MIKDENPILNSSDLCAIYPSGIWGLPSAPFDLYVMAEGAPLKILNLGAPINLEEVKNFLPSPDGQVFFESKERRTYLKVMSEVIERKIAAENADEALEIYQVLVSQGMMLAEELYLERIDLFITSAAKSFGRHVDELLALDKRQQRILRSICAPGDSLQSHLFLTVLLAVLISRNLDWMTEKTLESVVLGAFLHDVGLMRLPPEVRDVTEERLDPEKFEEHKKHPYYGLEFLGEVTHINEQVRQIVYQHHEYLNGLGYPNKLTGAKIFPLAKIVSLADGFSDCLMANKQTPIEELKRVLADREFINRYDPVMLKALVKGFQSKKDAPTSR